MPLGYTPGRGPSSGGGAVTKSGVIGTGVLATDLGGAAAGNAINPNDVGYDLILLLGQSNMAGRGVVLDSRLDITDPRIFTYGNPVQTGNAYAGVVSQAVEPLLQRDGATGVGPGLPFARWYTTVIPTNRRVLLVPCAVGGTPLVPTNQLSWNSTITGANSLYQSALSTLLAALTQAGANSRIVAALWLQGETDGDSGASGSSYQTALDALVTKLRSDLGLPNLPFVLGQMVPDYLNYQLTPGTSNRLPINAVHIDTPRRTLYTGFGYGPAGSAFDNGDNNHYNAFGQRGPVAKPQLSVGHSMFLAYQRALVNVTGAAPIVPAAPALAQSSATALAASWPQVSGRLTDYNVRYSTNAGSSWTNLTRAQSIDINAAITGLPGGAAVLVQVASVNEQGTSAWSASGSLTLLTAPGQVTGLTAGTATGSTQPLTWTAAAGASSYLIEKSSDSGTTWTSVGTPTLNSGTATGLSPSTSYQYRVSAVNVAGSGTPSSTVTASTSAATGPISIIGVSAYRAYGTRRTRDAYSGNCMTVRRDSDNTTQAIGFTAGGDLDTTALATFVGSASAYVVTLNDQSGNGYDLTQATTAAQPRIVNAGTLDMLNGKPTIVFSGAQILIDATNVSAANCLYSQAALTAQMVMQAAQPSTLTVPFGDASTTASAIREWIAWTNASSSVPNVQIRNDASTNLVNQAGTVALYSTSGAQYTFLDSGTQTLQRVNAASSAALTNYAAARTGTVTPNRFAVGGTYPSSSAGYFLTGKFSELIIFGSALTSTNYQSVEASQKAYYGTP